MYPYISIGDKTIGTYGICMTAAIILIFCLAARDGRNRNLCLDDLLIVGAFSVGIGLLCASFMYIFITYPLPQLIRMIQTGNFKFLRGGLVFYGGLIGGLIGALPGIMVAKCSFRSIEESVVPYLPLGHAIGRIGCVLAGCCHGFAYDGPLAIYYVNSISGLSPHQGYFPTQLLEAVLNVGVWALLMCIRSRKKRNGDLILAYIGIYGIVRFIVEFFRGDKIRGSVWGFSTSQWISIALVVIAPVWYMIRRKRKNMK